MMARVDSRAFRPTLSGLEVRCVPTVISPLAFGGKGLAAQRALQTALGHVLSGHVTPAATPGIGGTFSPTGTIADSNGGTNVANPSSSLYLDPATLTQRGLARDRFVTQSYGPFAVTQPAYVGPLREVTYIGSVVSTQFLQGTMVTRLDTPAAIPTNLLLSATNPGQLDYATYFQNNTAGTGAKPPVDGYAAFRNRNVASTGNILVLDLTVTQEDASGRPTRLSWIVDDNGSGGVYAGAAGQGTATITYFAKSHSKLAAGSAGIVWTGLVNPNGVNDITQFDQPVFN